MRSAGAERVGKDAAVSMIDKAEEYIADQTKKALKFSDACGRKTVKAEDIERIDS